MQNGKTCQNCDCKQGRPWGKVLLAALLLAIGAWLCSCEDEPILTPDNAGTTGGSYGRLAFPDSIGWDTLYHSNPEVR